MEELKKRLEVEDIIKTFVSARGGEFEAIRDVSFSVRDSEFLVLLGSGPCGKAIPLNILMSLEEATSGTIRLDGQELGDCNDKVSMVFQKLGLFFWGTVMENVEVGLKYTDVSEREQRERVQKFTDLAGLAGFEGACPGQLSGGMRQRVGIARVYTANPEILIPDESSDQLDAQTRYSMEDEMLRTWEQEKKTVISVTDNTEETVYLEGRIILLEKCPILVREIYDIDLPGPRNMVDKAFLEPRIRVSDNMKLLI